jgi:hypothetical protein
MSDDGSEIVADPFPVRAHAVESRFRIYPILRRTEKKSGSTQAQEKAGSESEQSFAASDSSHVLSHAFIIPTGCTVLESPKQLCSQVFTSELDALLDAKN